MFGMIKTAASQQGFHRVLVLLQSILTQKPADGGNPYHKYNLCISSKYAKFWKLGAFSI